MPPDSSRMMFSAEGEQIEDSRVPRMKMNQTYLSRATAVHVVGGLLLLLTLVLGGMMLAGCELADPIQADTMRAEAASGLRVLLKSSGGVNAPSGDQLESSGNFNLLTTDITLDDLVAETNVTISRVVLYGEEGARRTLSDEVRTFNLLELQDGVTALLSESDDLPVGSYHQIRLEVRDAEVVLVSEEGKRKPFDLKVPSDAIRVPLEDFEIVAGQQIRLTLDFDVAESFIVKIEQRGLFDDLIDVDDIKGFMFKPVVRVLGVNYNYEAHQEEEREGD